MVEKIPWNSDGHGSSGELYVRIEENLVGWSGTTKQLKIGAQPERACYDHTYIFIIFLLDLNSLASIANIVINNRLHNTYLYTHTFGLLNFIVPIHSHEYPFSWKIFVDIFFCILSLQAKHETGFISND